jgi:KipI family sensor histidine kinase inhibitor
MHMPARRELPRIDLPAQFRALGDSALLFEFGAVIDASTNERVLAAWRALAGQLPAGVLDLVPAYTTLGVHFDPARWDACSLAAALRALPVVDAPAHAPAARCIEIPVLYGGEAGPDLPAVCAHTGLAPEEVVRRHAAVEYRVNFLGFTPGFPYLGGLDPALATPRRATPRTAVPAGSVAIGGAQTGVYPQAAPGGWQLIGRTPLALFDAARDPPCLLAPGDRLRFVAIDARAFTRLAAEG